MNFHYSVCTTCANHMERRRTVLLPAMADHCDKTGEHAGLVLHHYMTGVHDRHMSGLSLAVSA